MVFLFALLSLAGLPLSSASCSGARDCNPPEPYSNLKAMPAGTIPTIHKTPNYPAATVAMHETALTTAVRFLGAVGPAAVFLYERGGADAAYANLTKHMCEFTKDTRSNCGESETAAAKDTVNVNYFKAYLSGGGSLCECSGLVYHLAPLYLMPGPNDFTNKGEIMPVTIHEYVHIFQKKAGDYPGAWLMEGGAVQLQYMLGPVADASLRSSPQPGLT